MMKTRLYLTIFLSLLISSAAATQISNCTNEEATIFTCSVKKKVLSICASKNESPQKYIEYRYSVGKKNPSFIYRADKSNPTRSFNRASVLGASSESIIIWFENDNYTYLVNNPIKGYPSVSVWKAGREIADNQCTGNYGGDAEVSNPLIRERSSEDYFKILETTKD